MHNCVLPQRPTKKLRPRDTHSRRLLRNIQNPTGTTSIAYLIIMYTLLSGGYTNSVITKAISCVFLILLITGTTKSTAFKFPSKKRTKTYSYKSKFPDHQIYQSTFTAQHLEIMKNETRSLFNYAWTNYMDYGFPYDEVKPLMCEPNKPDFRNVENKVKNDVMGNYSLTLFDNLDTFVIMNDYDGFVNAVRLVNQTYTNFAINTNVQVFEANIRILGGLLSAHLYAGDERKGFSIPGYDGFLLRLAYDLGKRLILAFTSDTNIPYPRTNLMNGPRALPYSLLSEQCTAGVTSLILEFSLLSRLSGDPIFEDITRDIEKVMWTGRSKLDLLPMTIDVNTGQPSDQITGVGASIDSFYEYALKYAVLFDDDEFLNIWKTSYASLLTNSQDYYGTFLNIHISSGIPVTEWIDALSAFFPGLQVLAGDVSNAELFHLIFMKLWNYYGVIPERWNYHGKRSEGYFQYLLRPYRLGDLADGFDRETTDELLFKNSVGLEWYPLRPEFVESSYHLYRATKDPIYLKMGQFILKKFKTEFLAPCGFSGVQDVRTGSRQDRMESFVLSETLKYLYLLFDEGNQVHSSSCGNSIFSTEGHVFWYDKKVPKYDLPGEELKAKQKVVDSNNTTNGGYFNRLFKDNKFDLDFEFNKLKATHESRGDLVEVRFSPLIRAILEEAKHEIPSHVIEGENVMLSRNLYDLIKPYLSSEYEMKGIDEFDLKLNQDYLGLDTCQVPTPSFFYSRLLQDPKLYDLDEHYQMTLVRPPYLSGNLELELEDPFYSHFSPSNKVQCQRKPTTQIIEAMIDDENRNIHIFKIEQSNKLEPISTWFTKHRDDENAFVIPDDYYLTDLTGLRLLIENLEVGKLDSTGEFITEEHVKRFDSLNVLRILKLNGLSVDKNAMIWVDVDCDRFQQNTGVQVSSSGFIILNGAPTENMRVWVH